MATKWIKGSSEWMHFLTKRCKEMSSQTQVDYNLLWNCIGKEAWPTLLSLTIALSASHPQIPGFAPLEEITLAAKKKNLKKILHTIYAIACVYLYANVLRNTYAVNKPYICFHCHHNVPCSWTESTWGQMNWQRAMLFKWQHRIMWFYNSTDIINQSTIHPKESGMITMT